MPRLLVKNTSVVLLDNILKNHSILCDDKKIVKIGPDSEMQSISAEQTVDAGGKYLASGFIDLHIHGTHNYLVDNHESICHINSDVYHMQVEESYISEAILKVGQMLTNLHLADSNRCALGDGSMDLDTIIKAFYVIGYNNPGCYCTPNPLKPGGDPYPAMYESQMLSWLILW